MTTQLTRVNYTVEYNCTAAGLIALDAAQQLITAMLSGPDDSVTVRTLAHSGLTIPANIQPGNTWQQIIEWGAANSTTTSHGTFTFNYTALGLEAITVPLGSFDAMRINVEIQLEIGDTARMTGTYANSMWLVKDIGMIKSDGASHIPGVQFTDRLELESFDSP